MNYDQVKKQKDKLFNEFSIQIRKAYHQHNWLKAKQLHNEYIKQKVKIEMQYTGENG